MVGLRGVFGVLERRGIADPVGSAKDLQVAAERGEDVDTGDEVRVTRDIFVFLVLFWAEFDVCNADSVCVHLLIEFDETT